MARWGFKRGDLPQPKRTGSKCSAVELRSFPQKINIPLRPDLADTALNCVGVSGLHLAHCSLHWKPAMALWGFPSPSRTEPRTFCMPSRCPAEELRQPFPKTRERAARNSGRVCWAEEGDQDDEGSGDKALGDGVMMKPREEQPRELGMFSQERGRLRVAWEPSPTLWRKTGQACFLRLQGRRQERRFRLNARKNFLLDSGKDSLERWQTCLHWGF